MYFTENDHTFVVCAYKESPYLKECIDSLMAQTISSTVIVSTSTPNEYIKGLAEKYGLPVVVNHGIGNMADNFNFAYSQAKTKLVTLCHQDDFYSSQYLEKVLEKVNVHPRFLIAFTHYAEYRGEQYVYDNKLLSVKKTMLRPLKHMSNSRFVRRRVLSFGCPICCPSVTYHKEVLPSVIFEQGFSSNIDWQAWEKLSSMKGSFVYVPEPLTFHRVHEESETTRIIGENQRSVEDFKMFCKFWPKPIAGFVNRFYSKGQDSNNQNV